MKFRLLGALFALSASPLAALAEQVFTENVIVSGNLCAGAQCIAGESFDIFTEMKIKSNLPGLEFDDTSTGSNPHDDWRLFINDGNSSGYDRFSIENLTDNVKPFTIIGGAPENALVVAGNGWIGAGTLFPQANLHIAGSTYAALRLEDLGSGGTPVTFNLVADNDQLYLRSGASFAYPLLINSNAHDYGLVIDKGNTGIGTLHPQARLHIDLDSAGENGLFLDDGADYAKSPEAMAHIHSETGNAMLLIEEDGAASTPRTLLNLQNNGRPEIVMGNTHTGGEWSFGAGTNFILKQGAVGTASSVKTKLFQIAPSGDATVYGTLVTQGPTCTSGCDAVFDPGYDRPSQAEYARRMWARGHLPHVGPTTPGAAINLPEKLGGMLNALEQAHIFIDQQAGLIAHQTDHIARLEARLARLESRLDSQGGAADDGRPHL